jgi:polar amino acid transport system substrate-binding protein
MTLRVAYVEEPPFYWTTEDGSVTGADVELARVVLAAGGETSIEIDAFAATTVGNRAIVATTPGLDAVPAADDGDAAATVGAFSFATGNEPLIQTVNAQLRQYLGSADHRARMANYGITRAEIDGALSAR